MTTGNSERPSLVLASASPRRRELLQQIGIDFRVVVPDIEEKPLVNEKPGDFVLRMAREKALEVMQREGVGLPVLGAETSKVPRSRK